MKKIAVVGLYSIKNVGDNILCDAAQYLIKECEPDVQFVEVDVNPKNAKSYKGFNKLRYFLARGMIFLSGKIFSYENHSRFRYYYEYLMWWLKINGQFREKLKGVDAIVFCGGGFLKFRTQGLNYYVEQIVRIAEKNHIPIMMNGVGIEGYDEHDIRCQRLKRMINKNCMKVITTRDDIDTLQNHYIVNPKIRTARVGDCAFWIPECYGVERRKPGEDAGVVGINVIRGKVYQAYGNSLSELELMNFYKALIRGLEDRGIDWVLFSNGMKADQVFGRQLLKGLGYRVSDKLLPAPEDTMQFLETIRGFRGVFGARLHACITAYALDVPVVGLIWSEKLQIFSELIGKPQNFFTEDQLDVEHILDTLEEGLKSPYDAQIRDALRNETAKYIRWFIKRV